MIKTNDNLRNSITFLDNILLLDSFESEKKEYNMTVDYINKNNHYLLKLVLLDNKINIIDTECILENKKKGSILIKDIINMVTKKYNQTLIIDVKELDSNNNCIKFGRRVYN